MKKILYCLLDNSGVNRTYEIRGANIVITVRTGDKGYLLTSFPGQRYHSIYLEACLNTLEYRDWIDQVLKPMCTVEDAEGVIFI